MSIVSASSIASRLNKEYSPEQLTELQEDIDAIQYELEGALNHVLERREITRSFEVMPQGHINLRGPVVRIISVVREGAETSADWYPMSNTGHVRDALHVRNARAGESYEVTYIAGDQTPDPSAVRLIRDVTLRNRIVGLQVAVGAYQTVNVEGASVGYGSAASRSSDTAKGSFSAAELSMVRHLRRLVTR